MADLWVGSLLMATNNAGFVNKVKPLANNYLFNCYFNRVALEFLIMVLAKP